jgi:hypothetical protein
MTFVNNPYEGWISKRIVPFERRLTKRAQMKGEVKGADELRIGWLHGCARKRKNSNTSLPLLKS